MTDLRSPYPFFGGKRRVASLVWERFGNTVNYVEPFFGSGAVLLGRPHTGKTETVNDANAFISNFWRALKAEPDVVAFHADWPVSEVDLHARHLWLVSEGVKHVERCKNEPEYYDAKIAGWWVWGACQWIGSGWCDGLNCRGAVTEKLPHLMNDGKGIHRLTHKIPILSGAHGKGIQCGENKSGITQYLQGLSDRLRSVRVCCGDWSRVMGETVTWRHGVTAVFLDPPYSEPERTKVYAVETVGVAEKVRDWCHENGENRQLRIALCGYSGEGHETLEAAGWSLVAWKAAGGYGSQGKGDTNGRENAKRERIWFSPFCLSNSLFGHENDADTESQEVTV